MIGKDEISSQVLYPFEERLMTSKRPVWQEYRWTTFQAMFRRPVP